MRTWQIELSSILSAYQKGFADLETTVARMKLPKHEIPDDVTRYVELSLRRDFNRKTINVELP
jgi:hypothetical protein